MVEVVVEEVVGSNASGFKEVDVVRVCGSRRCDFPVIFFRAVVVCEARILVRIIVGWAWKVHE